MSTTQTKALVFFHDVFSLIGRASLIDSSLSTRVLSLYFFRAAVELWALCCPEHGRFCEHLTTVFYGTVHCQIRCLLIVAILDRYGDAVNPTVSVPVDPVGGVRLRSGEKLYRMN